VGDGDEIITEHTYPNLFFWEAKGKFLFLRRTTFKTYGCHKRIIRTSVSGHRFSHKYAQEGCNGTCVKLEVSKLPEVEIITVHLGHP